MESQLTHQPPREHQRFKAKQRALVFFPEREQALPYHIIDISEGGLAFRYLGNKLKSSERVKVSLYHEYDLIIDSIQAETVSDFKLRENLVPVRRGSISFSGLNQEQRNKLSAYIQQFAEGPH